MAKSKAKRNQRARLLISLALMLLIVLLIDAAMSDPLGLFGPQQVFYDNNANQNGPASTIQSPSPATPAPANVVLTGETLDVYILDVGQGDSIFLKSPSGKTMLVDASTSGMYNKIDAFLKDQNVTKLDVVIATHPHADHIGAMEKIVKNYEIGVYYMPDAVATSQTFESLLDALKQAKVNVKKAQADTFISWDEDVEARILSPFKGEKYSNLNDYSVVCRLRYGEMAIMLTGDAEKEAEDRILQEFTQTNLNAQILKMGHHGSSTSSSLAFLKAVEPDAAIMSLGSDNTYGHPHKETIEKLDGLKIKYYRTDLMGTIFVRMSKTAFTVETEK